MNLSPDFHRKNAIYPLLSFIKIKLMAPNYIKNSSKIFLMPQTNVFLKKIRTKPLNNTTFPCGEKEWDRIRTKLIIGYKYNLSTVGPLGVPLLLDSNFFYPNQDIGGNSVI